MGLVSIEFSPLLAWLVDAWVFTVHKGYTTDVGTEGELSCG